MAYVDSSGKTHVSLSEAASGHVAQTTASRDTAGNVVGDSTGSRYVRKQEEQAQEQEVQAKAAEQEQQKAQYLSQYQQQQDARLQQQMAAVAQERPTTNPFQQQTEPTEKGLWPRTISTFKTGYTAGRSGNLSLGDLKDLSAPGWGVEGAIAGKVVSAGVGIIGEDRLKAYNAGYEIGRGRDADISSLEAPKQSKDKMISAPLYEWTDNLTGSLSAYRNVLVRPIPAGPRQVVTGLSDIPIAVIDTFGKAPMGVETIVRNPTTSFDSVGLGLGILAGGIVTTGEKEPGRLVGQAVGGYYGGKGLGAAWSKIKPAKVEKVSITETERQFSVLEGVEKTKIETLGTPREYLKIKTRVAGENELNPLDIKTANDLFAQDSRTFNVKYTKTRSLTDSNLNTETRAASGSGQITLQRPSILQAEQKTLSGETILKVDKGKWDVKFSGIADDKFAFKKQYPVESYLGKETFDYDYATSVENIRTRPINEVLPTKETTNPLPEGAELYFDVSKTPKQASVFDNFGEVPDSLPTVKPRTLNLFPGEKPGLFAYDRIGLSKNSFKNTIRRLTEDESGSLAPLREPQVIPGKPKAELDVWKRDILLEELQPKFTTTVKSFEIPNTYSSMWGWGAAGLSGILSSGVGELSIQNNPSTQVNNPVTHGVWAANAPKLATSPDILEKSDLGLLSRSDNILGTWQGLEQDLRQDSVQDSKLNIKVIPSVLPDILPGPVLPDIFPNTILPDIFPNPTPGNTWVDPLQLVPFPQNNKKIPLPLGDGSLSIFPSSEPGARIRKTKHKTIKNEYGDPFKIKLNL